MKMIGVGIVFLSWWAFVFAMCYFFSPWFAFLLLITPKYKDGE